MENPDHWDRLTAALAVSNLDDLDDAWAFLQHANLVEPMIGGGAKQRFVAAVARQVAYGEITGPSLACRVASSIRDLCTWRAAEPDPHAQYCRGLRDQWQVIVERYRASSRAFAAYPGARRLDAGSVAGQPPHGLHITWASYAVAAPMAAVLAHYQRQYGPGEPVAGTRQHGFVRDNHRLTVCPAADASNLPGCGKPLGPGEETVLLISTSAGPA